MRIYKLYQRLLNFYLKALLYFGKLKQLEVLYMVHLELFVLVYFLFVYCVDILKEKIEFFKVKEL